MMKKLFILSLVLVLLTIIPVFAQEPSYTFQQHTNNTLRVYCNNDTLGLCDNSVSCNINIQKPSTISIVNNGTMDFIDAGQFGFNLTENDSNEIGIYSAFGSCNGNAFNFAYQITPTGHTLSISQSIITILGILSIIFVGIIFLFLSGVAQSPGTKIPALGMGLLLIVFSIGYSLNLMQRVAGEFDSINLLFSRFYVMLTLLLIAGGLALTLFLVIIAFKSFSRMRGLTLD